ncbi:hypothetical protein TWF703_004724 [Orbilia oligospora]|uniref:Uncharacterized protein n=1 Tax=Orbilia oligospora TaxID=2813651 RepID=A0A7C8JXK5_ORBOL|nr:hypothetical protein TWF703_004724 [Orbilia oligospora]
MPQFKPTQRKNGAIVLTMHKNLGPPALPQEDNSQSSQQIPQCQRKRQHSTDVLLELFSSKLQPAIPPPPNPPASTPLASTSMCTHGLPFIVFTISTSTSFGSGIDVLDIQF